MHLVVYDTFIIHWLLCNRPEDGTVSTKRNMSFISVCL